MSKSYTKLFSSITESTVWCEPHETVRVWITILAMADRYGRVWASIPGLANRARVTIDECQTALDCFLGPDKYSRTPDNEGRRIEVIPDGWRLLNHEKYRDMRDDEAQLERAAERQRRFRERHGSNVPHGTVTPSNAGVTLHNAQSRGVTASNPIADADASAKQDTDLANGFGQFWKLWPKRVARAAAERAWTKIAPDARALRRILAAVAEQSRSPDWTKDGGKFIPHPATWLNGRRWEDEAATPRGAGDGIGTFSASELAP